MEFNFEQSNQEESFEDAINHNLLMMEDPLDRLRETESLGGNAGAEVVDGKKYPCYGLNGYVEKNSGKIIVFGNFQNIKPEIVEGGVHITLKEVFNFSGVIKGTANGKVKKIIRVYGIEGCSEEARRVILESVERYNNIHWV